MNLDPRSNYLNAEIVALIKSHTLAERMKPLFDTAFDTENVFKLALEPKAPYKEVGTGRLVKDETEIIWLSEEDNGTVKYYNDAGASSINRLKANLLYYLPIGDTI
jgi:phosphatidylserine/phosphatidylglycerophosphate/cardiolipin synthase-like enzyme